ncbi:MAG: helix-turn-helix domain-containing protein [Kangiellaceae bacterium]|nr:helix-turn-helix domain-containing protein [Kangiellaceae bacterium]MCW9017414.1 helix-turn-helix domain-containing protein [Kangiellaceae bacterium]
MELLEYINSFTRSERMSVRQELACQHGVSEVTVRAWANGTRKHPCTLSAIEVTERATSGKVSRHELRPDIFGPAKSSGTSARRPSTPKNK